MSYLKFLKIVFVLGLVAPALASGTPPERQYYEIRIYHLSTAEQEKTVDDYLKNALIPALHRNNVPYVGVFEALANDTAAIKKIYLLVPYKSLEQFGAVNDKLEKDQAYLTAGAAYLDAPYTNPPYLRIERIFSKAFKDMPVMQPVKMNSDKAGRVYEIRSYESATEKLHAKKVQMFNDGDEIGLFKRLGFNAVFYSQAISGAALPNLIYMITFDDMAAHDRLWENFKNDPYWKKLSALPEYQNIVSKSDIFLLRPADYSDY